ncbi:transglycosylase domain-containing protein [Terrabacter koreensis]
MAQPAQGSHILAADGSVIATPQDEDRVVVPLSEVAPVMRTAQVAIEDSRFYDHGAIDPQGLARAVLEDLRTGQASEGASTLTQQFVKLSLQAQALRDGQTAAARAAIAKTIPRKLEDLRYAVALERSWSKDEILQGYLDLAYYGDGAYGVEAAARHYFDVHASALTLTEAATLAGLVQSPSTTDPAHHPRAAQARRNVVLARMRALDELTPRQYAAAVARPLSRDLTTRRCARSHPSATASGSPQPPSSPSPAPARCWASARTRHTARVPARRRWTTPWTDATAARAASSSGRRPRPSRSSPR